MYARLRHGDHTFPLDGSGNCALSDDFIPPAMDEMPLEARGTSANRRGGGLRTGQSSNNLDFGFSLDIFGDTNGEIERAVDDLNGFLELAGDESEPVYFDFIPNRNLSKPPVHGQWNGVRSLEIVWGICGKPPGYGLQRVSLLEKCPVILRIKPVPLGQEHLCGVAFGCVYEDVWPDDGQGNPTGVFVHPGGDNLITNPALKNDATGWTKTAGLEIMERSDREALFYGWSLRLADSSSAGSAEYAFSNFMTVTAAQSYIAAARIKKTVHAVNVSGIGIAWYTAADAFISSDVAEFDLGTHDWKRYFVTATAPGTAAKARIWIILAASGAAGQALELFADGISFRAGNTLAPYGDGDFPGSTWSGTAHASTSNMAIGLLYYSMAKLLPKPYQATICVELQPYIASTAMPNASRVIDAGSITFLIGWDSGNTRFYFLDNFGHYTFSAAVSFAALDKVAIHLALSGNAAQFYINGVVSGSAGTYQPNPSSGNLYIGNNSAGTSNGRWLFLGLQTYDYALTAAEITADYANMLPLLTAGKRIDWLMYAWGSADYGDGTVQLYNANDAAAQTNFTVICGVPGNIEAITRFLIITPNISTGQKGGFFLSRMLVPLDLMLGRFTKFFGELSGTADANSSGSAYESKAAVGTTPVNFTRSIDLSYDHVEVLSGQQIALLCRLRDVAGTNLQVRFYYMFGSDTAFYSAWKPIESANWFLSRLTSFQTFKDVRRGVEGLTLVPYFPTPAGFYLEVKRSTGSGDVYCDYYQIVTKPTLRIYSTSSASAGSYTRYDSKTHDIINLFSTTLFGSDLAYVEGDRLELMPGKKNYLIWAPGDIKRELAEVVDSHVASLQELTVIPRWRVQ